MTMDANGQMWLDYKPATLLELYTAADIFDRADEHMYRRLKEDNRLECKPNGQHPESLGIYFSMWANTPGGGLIVLGVRNDKTFEGCLSVGTKRLNNLELAGQTYCPDARYETKKVPITRDDDGGADFLMVIRVHYNERRVVKTNTGDVWVRRGDQKKQLKTTTEIRELESAKGEVSFEAEPCGLEYPKDFDSESIQAFAEVVRERKGWDDEHSLEDILRLMHLGKLESGKFVPNYACAALFANDPRAVLPGCRIRFLRFEGDGVRTGEGWNATKDEWIDGPIPELIQSIQAMLASQLRTFSRLGPGGKFYTAPEYPPFVWYEAVVNACAHRSYGNGLKNSPIFVRMFDDRLEVESPGPFPPFITPDNIYEASHTPRNPYLMDAMFYLEYVKCAREGTRRMRDLMIQYDLPVPKFGTLESGHASVKVTLKNNVKQRRVWVDADVVPLLGAQIAASLTDDEKRIINHCQEWGKINITQAQRLIGGDWGAVRKKLTGLANRKILEHVHRDDVVRDSQAHFVLIDPRSPKGGKV